MPDPDAPSNNSPHHLTPITSTRPMANRSVNTNTNKSMDSGNRASLGNRSEHISPSIVVIPSGPSDNSRPPQNMTNLIPFPLVTVTNQMPTNNSSLPSFLFPMPPTQSRPRSRTVDGVPDLKGCRNTRSCSDVKENPSPQKNVTTPLTAPIHVEPPQRSEPTSDVKNKLSGESATLASHAKLFSWLFDVERLINLSKFQHCRVSGEELGLLNDVNHDPRYRVKGLPTNALATLGVFSLTMSNKAKGREINSSKLISSMDNHNKEGKEVGKSRTNPVANANVPGFVHVKTTKNDPPHDRLLPSASESSMSNPNQDKIGTEGLTNNSNNTGTDKPAFDRHRQLAVLRYALLLKRGVLDITSSGGSLAIKDSRSGKEWILIYLTS